MVITNKYACHTHSNIPLTLFSSCDSSGICEVAYLWWAFSGSAISLSLSTSIKPACCGAEIDVDSTAFVFSLANSKFIFLTFFYLFSSHSFPLCLPHHPPLLVRLLYLCSSSVHLYSPQTRVSPIASLYHILCFFPPSLIFLLCITSPSVPLNSTPHLSFPLFLHLISAPTSAAAGPSLAFRALCWGHTYSKRLELEKWGEFKNSHYNNSSETWWKQ